MSPEMWERTRLELWWDDYVRGDMLPWRECFIPPGMQFMMIADFGDEVIVTNGK